MSPPPRRHVARFVFAVLGVALVYAVGYLGLGWAVRLREPWLRHVFSERTLTALDRSYCDAVSTLRPRDSDGDGFGDGFEWYGQYDVKNGLHHPGLRFAPARRAPVIDCRWFEFQSTYGWESVVYHPIDQRRRLTVLQRRDMGVTVAHGFKLKVHGGPGVLLALPGEPLSDQPLIVPVDPDGAAIFDFTLTVQVASASPANLPRAPQFLVSLQNAFTGEALDSFTIDGLWVDPSVEPTVEVLTAGQMATECGKLAARHPMGLQAPAFRLHWPEVPASVVNVLVEASESGLGDDWVPIAFQENARTSCDLLVSPALQSAPSPSRIKFRVTPIRAGPPR